METGRSARSSTPSTSDRRETFCFASYDSEGSDAALSGDVSGDLLGSTAGSIPSHHQLSPTPSPQHTTASGFVVSDASTSSHASRSKRKRDNVKG